MSAENFVPEIEENSLPNEAAVEKAETSETTKESEVDQQAVTTETIPDGENVVSSTENPDPSTTQPLQDDGVKESAELPPGLQQRYLSDQWIARYEKGPFMKYVNDEWKEIEEDDERELIEQLWYEQEASEIQVVNGVKCKWDSKVQQWIPIEEVDDDFIANYQQNYGIAYDYGSIDKKSEEQLKEEEEKKKEEEKKAELKKKGPQPPGWLDMDEKVAAVYVSNLPLDIDEEEFHQFMHKAGVVQLDPRTNKPKVKLYKDEQGNLKGDGRCCYVKKESIEIALTILDGADLKGSKISVEQAHFELKGEYDPKKKKRKLNAQQKKRFLESQDKIFAWIPEKSRSYRPKSDCTVIVTNVFTLDMMNKNAALLLDLKEEMIASCAKYGTVKKVVVYDNNPEGVVTVQFTNTDESDLAIKMMNGRIVDGRLLTAHHWDGKTKYMVAETEEEKAKRLEEYAKFIGDNSSEEEVESDEEKTKKTKEAAMESVSINEEEETSAKKAKVDDDDEE